jgi:hypothetical protein
MTLGRRLLKLEQERTGGAGAGIWGVLGVHHLTGTGPDAVRVPQTGETLTTAGFRARYPLGLLIERQEYGDLPPGDEWRGADRRRRG